VKRSAPAGSATSWELVASAKTTEEKLQEMASELAQVPGLIAAGVTSYAGGSAGHDPIRIGEIVKEQGLTPMFTSPASITAGRS